MYGHILYAVFVNSVSSVLLIFYGMQFFVSYAKDYLSQLLSEIFLISTQLLPHSRKMICG